MAEENQDDKTQQTDQVTIEQIQKDLDSAMDGWKRTAADFENYRRRKEAENKELVEFAREVTVAKLLPALDSLEQALKHMPELSLALLLEKGGNTTVPAEQSPSLLQREGWGEFPKQYQNWQTGVNGIVLQLDKTLEELGVNKIEAVGKKFDPHFHEAIREVESDQEDGTVVDEVQTGFELNGKVIRPSQVVISKKII